MHFPQSNLTATNNFIRGTGDDAMAINSVNYNTFGSQTIYYTAMSNVTLTRNSLIAPWGGKGIGIYGGSGHNVADNYIDLVSAGRKGDRCETNEESRSDEVLLHGR